MMGPVVFSVTAADVVGPRRALSHCPSLALAKSSWGCGSLCKTWCSARDGRGLGRWGPGLLPLHHSGSPLVLCSAGGRGATPQRVSHLPLTTKWHRSAGAQGTNETKKGGAMWTINSLLPIWTQILWCTDVPFFNIVITLRQRTCWLTTKHVSFFWWCLNTFLLAKDLHLHCRLLVKLLWSHLSKANGSRVFLSTTKKKGNTFK